MRIKLALLIAAVAATAMPAVAQGYGRNCAEARQSNQVGGAILGGLLGGIAGSNIAASGHRHDGTAVGAVLGGVLGAGIGGNTRCAPPQVQSGPLPPPPGTYAPGYGYNDGQGYGGQYSQYPSDPGYSSGHGYDDDYRDDPYGRDYSSRRNDRDSVYGRDDRSYRHNDGYAGRDCSDATQITRLPDGTVIKRPVEACRDAYYGDWQVRD